MAEIIAGVLANGVLLVAVLLLAKVWFEKSLDAANSRELERLRAELRIAESRTTRFDERRFKALNDVYRAIAVAHMSFKRWMAPMRPEGQASEDEDRELADQSFVHLVESLNRNRLWLGVDLAKHVDSIVDALNGAARTYLVEEHRDWTEIGRMLTVDIPRLRQALEAQAEELLSKIEHRQE